MVEAALNHTAVEVEAPSARPSDYFGVKVFGRNVMRKYLDKPTYDALLNTMDNGTSLSLELADSVAAVCVSGRLTMVRTTILTGFSH